MFGIKKKAPFEPAVADLAEAYGVEDSIDASEFEWIGSNQGSANSIVRPSISFWKDVLRRVRRSKVAVVCSILLGLMILGAIFVPIFSPFTIDQQNVAFSHQPPFSVDPVTGQTYRHRCPGA